MAFHTQDTCGFDTGSRMAERPRGARLRSNLPFWSIVVLFGVLHIITLTVNLIRVSPTRGYDSTGHFAYLEYMAAHWQCPPADVTPQSFNPPLYYFSVAILSEVTGLELGLAGQCLNFFLAILTYPVMVAICRRSWYGSLLESVWVLALYTLCPSVYRVFSMVRPEAMLMPIFAAAGLLASARVSRPEHWAWIAGLSGLLAGIAFGVRQWGAFLFGGFFLWLVIMLLKDCRLRRNYRRFVACLCLYVAVFALICGGVLALRGGSTSTFNAPPQRPRLEFLTHLELPKLFNTPVRPFMNDRFWPVLYADLWGDYWRYWYEPLAYSSAPSSPQVVRALARSMWASLVPTLCIVAGLFSGIQKLIRRPKDSVSTRVESLSSTLLLVTVAGFMVFAAIYAQPAKGDTVKSVYVVYLMPFAALLAGSSAHWLRSHFHRSRAFVLIPLLPFVVFVLPVCFFKPLSSQPADVCLGGMTMREISPDTYAVLGTNHMRTREFDPRSSLIVPDGNLAWYFITEATPLEADLAERFFGNAQARDQHTALNGKFNYALYAADVRGDVEGVVASLSVKSPVWWSPAVDFRPGQEDLRHPLAVPVDFDHHLAFLGYELASDGVADGGELRLTTYWQVLARADPPLIIFVHLLDARGTVVAGWDGMGVSPARWRLDDIIIQQHRLPVSVDAVTGTHQLEIGMYAPDTMRRWAIYDGDEAVADRLLLQEIVVR